MEALLPLSDLAAVDNRGESAKDMAAPGAAHSFQAWDARQEGVAISGAVGALGLAAAKLRI